MKTKKLAKDPIKQSEHSIYVKSLREFSDWIESNPDLPLPSKEIPILSTTGKEDFSKVAKAFGTFKKTLSGEIIFIEKTIGCLTIQCVEFRRNICERRVVGKETVKEKKPIVFEEITIEQDIVEWHCSDSSLLK